MRFYKSEQKFIISSKNEIEDKIWSFLNLPKGWHYGSGFPPSKRTVNNALRINELAQLYGLRTDAVPGIEGEIQVICFSGDDTLEFTIESDGRVTFVREQKGQEVLYIENLSIEEAIEKLCDYGEKLCDLSASSTQITTSSTREDLVVWPSRIPLIAAEYQLFLYHV